ncbi:MAG TPA: hypothetical protein VFB71_13050 [Ramlibacter sp.]|nr:hypothetical protein [Ramlibacter sp.]
MARVQDGSAIPLGDGFSVAAITGTIAAALAQDSALFVARLSPTATESAYVDWLKLRWTTLIAFTTPITAGRQLALYRGSGAAASGGTAIAAAAESADFPPVSFFNATPGGDMRIATTGALTVAGITFETAPQERVTLSHVGAAGAFYETLLVPRIPILIAPGELIAIRNPVAMDAAGTFQLGVTMGWSER